MIGFVAQTVMQSLAVLLPAASLTMLNLANKLVGSISATFVNATMPLLVDPEVLDHAVVVFAAGLATESIRVGTGELFADQPVTILRLTRRDERASNEPIPQ